jgi:hypothetical protein
MPAPIDTPKAMKKPILLDFAIETCVTTTKLMPGMVITKNQINAMLLITNKYSTSSYRFPVSY